MNTNTLRFMRQKLGIAKSSPPLFSQASQNYLKSIYKVVEKSYKIKIPKLDIKRYNSVPRFGSSYNTIPEKVRHHIENNLSITYTCEFHIGERSVKANIITTPDQKNVNAELNQIYRWLYVASHFAHKKSCSRNISLYLYFTDLEKKLPESNTAVISAINANTAFTYACLPENEIYLYRREEWFKVFIHETFHSLGLDFSQSDELMDIGKREILHVFPVKSDVILSETYTEFMAEVLNNMFVSARSGSGGWLKFEKLMYNEILFSVFQANKVLDFMGIEYMDLYLRDEDSRRERMKYREDTAVFAYYVLKSILMIHINEFIEWCIHKHINSGGLQFRHSKDSILSFCEFIKRYHDTEKVEEFYSVAENALAHSHSRAERTNLLMTWGNHRFPQTPSSY